MKNINNIEIKISNDLVDYKESLKIMEKRVVDINLNNKKELIWFLYHDHIYTIGTSGSEKEIREKITYPVIKTNRGGKITYHGPGQRIVYFLIDLKKRKKDIRKFVSIIENSTINLLKEYNIEAKSYPEKIGIWVTKFNENKLKKERKIGAIGLRLKKWTTYHGLSFNINPNLKNFDKIDACGLKDFSTTSLDDLKINIDTKEFDELYLNFFLKELQNL